MTNFSFRKSIFGGNEVETEIKVEVARKSSNFEEKNGLMPLNLHL
jgi:hypothetical protein